MPVGKMVTVGRGILWDGPFARVFGAWSVYSGGCTCCYFCLSAIRYLGTRVLLLLLAPKKSFFNSNKLSSPSIIKPIPSAPSCFRDRPGTSEQQNTKNPQHHTPRKVHNFVRPPCMSFISILRKSNAAEKSRSQKGSCTLYARTQTPSASSAGSASGGQRSSE